LAEIPVSTRQRLWGKKSHPQRFLPSAILSRYEVNRGAPKVSEGRFWLISSRVVLYSLPMSNESKAKSAFMKPVQPDDALAKIVGANPLPRTELTKKLWEYIKQNKLQDKKLIKADAALETVFNGKKEVDMFELTRLVNTHIIK
jgi:chromatin remodeling complex protein RSC6